MSNLCKILQVSRSAYYAWLKRPVKVITANELMLYRGMKAYWMIATVVLEQKFTKAAT